MKNETIPGSTDATGLFTAKNPFTKFGTGNPQDYLHAEFNNAHPPLFCYNENNELVKGVDGLEVKGPVWQFKEYNTKGWHLVQDKADQPNSRLSLYQWLELMDNSDGYYQTRQVYIAVQPTEKVK